MFSHPAIRFVLTRARPHAGLFIVILVGEILASATALAIPQVAGTSIEALMANATTELSWSLFGVALLFTARLAFGAWAGFAAQNVANAVERTTRADFHAHLMSLPVADHQRLGTSALVDAEFRDLWTIRTLVLSQPVLLVGSLTTGVGALAFALSISWQLTALCILIAPALFLLVRTLGRYIERVSTAYWRALRAANKIDVENLEVVSLIKSYARVDARNRKFDETLQNVVEQGRRRNRLDATYSPITRSIELIGAAGLVYLTTHGWLGAKLNTVELSQFIMYSFLLVSPFRTLAGIALQLKEERGTLDKLAEILALQPEQEGSAELVDPRGQVSMVGVHFGYPSRENVLTNATMDIQPLEFVALTGRNGGGKSTLVNLMAGLWRPDEGVVAIDGIDIRTLSLNSLRRAVCLVQQHTEMLDTSIRENLIFVSSDANEEQLQWACHLSLTDELLTDLPDGLDTVVGEAGVRLSGGQRQRIALARAVVADPAVVILDEATSMFDPDSELRLLERMKPWFAQRTVVFITHRTAPVALATRVLVVENGQVFDRPVLDIDIV